MASYDVVIIGSGLVGASTANALMRAGAGRVLLLDRGNAGGGDSARGEEENSAILSLLSSSPS